MWKSARRRRYHCCNVGVRRYYCSRSGARVLRQYVESWKVIPAVQYQHEQTTRPWDHFFLIIRCSVWNFETAVPNLVLADFVSNSGGSCSWLSSSLIDSVRDPFESCFSAAILSSPEINPPNSSRYQPRKLPNYFATGAHARSDVTWFVSFQRTCRCARRHLSRQTV